MNWKTGHHDVSPYASSPSGRRGVRLENKAYILLTLSSEQDLTPSAIGKSEQSIAQSERDLAGGCQITASTLKMLKET
jgi:hypothetical protein